MSVLVETYQPTVLGKRKRLPQTYTFNLDSPEPTETRKPGPSRHVQSSSPTAPVKVTLEQRKKFICEWEGCGRSYSKPVRLEEHHRSHTGERPFVCPTCTVSYLRESHLKAHLRSHKTEEDKPCVCTRDGCGKRFWTNQHLDRHVKRWHEGVAGSPEYQCDQCAKLYTKHHLLRTHVAEAHCPEGTRPFRCDHEGCEKSFLTGVKLRHHKKTHDDNRYICAHPSCLASPSGPPKFPNFSSLQKHTKTVHPPTCPRPECGGRTFTTNRGLKNHLLRHDEREMEDGGETVGGEDDEDGGHGKRKRRWKEEGAEDNTWDCEEEDCDATFMSVHARSQHHREKHVEIARIPCNFEGCEFSTTRKYSLDRHVREKHPERDDRGQATSASAAPDVPPKKTKKKKKDLKSKSSNKAVSALDLLTGHGYVPTSRAGADDDDDAPEILSHPGQRKYACPFPAMVQEGWLRGADEDDELDSWDPEEGCPFRFKRVYDVQRHLSSAHGLEVDRDELEEWLDGTLKGS